MVLVLNIPCALMAHLGQQLIFVLNQPEKSVLSHSLRPSTCQALKPRVALLHMMQNNTNIDQLELFEPQSVTFAMFRQQMRVCG